ncbi:hypothetical protein [Comamonas testosteroni]|uniref:hypothetical protein n=1 Tax=Comamonas testosteroni TaxID=285 RepID=UPI000681086A|nr:hypothetical protein [Comamonas testosteroni]
MGIAKGIDLSKLVDYTAIEDGPWWRAGSGDSRFGQVGQQIGVVSLKHASDYAIVMQMQSGKIETFRPMQLFPYKTQAAAKKGVQHG